MTVVVAARTRGDGIVMASDSELTGGWQKGLHATPKVWVEGARIMGAAGSVRVAQIVRHQVEWPMLWPGDGYDALDVEKFLVRSVWPAIRDAASYHGVLNVDLNSSTESVEAEFILAWGDTLTEIDSSGAMILPPSGRAAIGSGYAEALGHLGDRGPWTRSQVVAAARKARISAVGVGGPIYVTSTRSLTVELVEE